MLHSIFKKSIRLTHGIDQQKDYLWGTAELVSWISLDGRKLEGVVYKPANFDPAKKYPMIVSFYERNSETLFNYRMPERIGLPLIIIFITVTGILCSIRTYVM